MSGCLINFCDWLKSGNLKQKSKTTAGNLRTQNKVMIFSKYRVSQKSVPVLNLNNSKSTSQKDKNKVFFES